MATTQVQYVGPFTAVDVVSDDGLLTVERGQTVEVDGEFAKRLLEQPDNWRKPGRDDASRRAARTGGEG